MNMWMREDQKIKQESNSVRIGWWVNKECSRLTSRKTDTKKRIIKHQRWNGWCCVLILTLYTSWNVTSSSVGRPAWSSNFSRGKKYRHLSILVTTTQQLHYKQQCITMVQATPTGSVVKVVDLMSWYRVIITLGFAQLVYLICVSPLFSFTLRKPWLQEKRLCQTRRQSQDDGRHLHMHPARRSVGPPLLPPCGLVKYQRSPEHHWRPAHSNNNHTLPTSPSIQWA